MQNELVKQYDGVLDAWKVRLALSRIRALGIGQSDWPDMMQELAMMMLNHSSRSGEILVSV